MAERVLLTGGSGFFGRRIAEALRRHGYDVATPGRPEFDLMDAALTRRAVERLRPDIIVHSAAYYGGLGICMAEPTQIFHRTSSWASTSSRRPRRPACARSWRSARPAPIPAASPAT